MNTDTCWFTNIRHWSSLSKLLLFNNFIFGWWQLNPHRFSLSFAHTLLQWLVQAAWLRLLILKQPKHKPTGTCTLSQLPYEPGLLLPAPGWGSHFPVAAVAAPCWGRSAGGVQSDWIKTRRESHGKTCAWLMTDHGVTWKEELVIALIQDMVNQGWRSGKWENIFSCIRRKLRAR